MDPNSAVFEVANDVLSEAVVDSFGESVENFRRELTRFLSDYSTRTFGIFGNYHFDLDGSVASSAGYPGSQLWAPLKEGYYDRKIREGHATGFYERTGSLRSQIQGANAVNAFGRPRVLVGVSGRTLNDNVYLDRAGRPQWRRGSGRRGFARYTEAFRDLAVSLTLDLFPLAQGKKTDQLIDRTVGGFDAFKWTLLEYGKHHQPARPALIPFLEWYSTTNLRASLAERFGIEVDL